MLQNILQLLQQKIQMPKQNALFNALKDPGMLCANRCEGFKLNKETLESIHKVKAAQASLEGQ